MRQCKQGKVSINCSYLRFVVFGIVVGSLSTAVGQIQELPLAGRLPASGVPGDFEQSGNVIFLGHGVSLSAVDVSDPASPTIADSISLEETAEIENSPQVSGLSLSQGFAYLSVNAPAGPVPNYGLQIVDVRNPFELTSAGVYDTGTSILGDIAVESTHVYLESDSGVKIIDVSDKTSPIELSSFSSAPIVGGQLEVRLGTVFYLKDDVPPAIEIFDVSNTSAPALVSSISLTGISSAFAVVGDKLYVASEGLPIGTLRVFDISNLAAPVELGSFDIAITPESVAVRADTAFVGGQDGTLLIVDVSTPNNMTLLSQVTDTAAAGLIPDGTVLHQLGKIDYRHSFRTLDITDESNPAPLGKLRLVVPNDVVLAGGLTVVAGESGLDVVEVLDIENPKIVASVEDHRFTRVEVTGNAAYLIEGFSLGNPNQGLRVYDISNPASPAETAFISSPTNLLDLFHLGHLLFVVDGSDTLRIFDTTNPFSPSQITAFSNFSPANALLFSAVHVAEDTAYLADTSNGLYIVDVSNPVTPQQAGFIGAPLAPEDMFVRDGIAYIADNANGLRIWNVTNPQSPVGLGFLGTGNQSFRIEVVEDNAFMSFNTGTAGKMIIVDISNPGQPVQTAETSLFGSPKVTNFLYATSSAGLLVYAIPPDAPVLDTLPRFINADVLTVSGTVEDTGEFITVGGGKQPEFQQLQETTTDFSIPIDLKPEALNTISVTTMNRFGLVSLPAIAPVVEGDAFPSTVETITALTISPDPAPSIPLDGSLPFTCEATFSDSSTADVTEFVQWEEIANNEVVTNAGLYINTESGAAEVRAFVAGVFSNVVTIGDS